MSDFIDLDLQSDELMMSLINRDNGTNLTLDDVTFATPVVVDDNTLALYNRNSSVRLKAKPGFSLFGARTFYYNRLDFGYFFRGAPVAIEDSYVSPQEALDLINTPFNLNVSIEEIVTQSVGDFTRIVITNSLVYLPGTYVDIFPATVLLNEEDVSDMIHDYVNITLPLTKNFNVP